MAAPRKSQILVVDDDQAHRLMLVTLLEEWGYHIHEALNGMEALEFIRHSPADLVLMDMRMPRMDGIEAAREIHRYNPAVPIVIMTAYSSIPSAVEALKSGAFDYLTKPLDFEELRLVMERALEHTSLKEDNEGLKRQLARFQTHEMVGSSPAMERLMEMVALVAPTEATVLLTGESGTGKGMIARAIHAGSSRRDKPLVEVNCAAIPETLIESELFGHEKGAFTGADRMRRGRFSMADGGTLFLDEIGDLPLPMQAKLLRALQEGEIQRVGSDISLPVNVRIIAATNRDIQQMLAGGSFREDLYYRLNVVALEVPPLRKRTEDIPILVQHFCSRFSKRYHKAVKGMTPQAMDLMLRYHWPGNIRELENVVERSVILLQGDYISPRELPLPLQKPALEIGAEPAEFFPEVLASGRGTLAEMEKHLVLKSLEETGWNKSEAARRLGITRRTLKLKLRRYEEEKSSGQP